jgi:predicted dehydrogenase
MNRLNRRQFVRGSAGALAGAAALPLISTRVAKGAPSDRVNLCLVGIRGRGFSVASNFARLSNARITHLCDVNTTYFARIGKALSDIQRTEPKCEQDLRRVLEDKTVDALIVATPDHWHALATIWGCQAGKHVYVEKPISHNVHEGRIMVAAARKHKCVVQVGTQSRSVPHIIEAINYARSGKLGKVHMAKAWNSQLRRRVNAVPDGKVPDTLDWDIWQGPAPERPYNDNRYNYGWRWMWDYGTGDMGNDGVHDLDLARWGLGVGLPATANCTAGKLHFEGDLQETPDTQIVTFTFPDSKAVLVYEQRLWSPYFQEGFENGIALYGTEGYLLLGRKGWKVVEKRNKVVLDKQENFSDMPHLENFLACIKSGVKPQCDIEEGHHSTTLAHLGNLSYRVGRPLKFDAKTHTITGDSEATALLKRKGRGAFVIPDEV